MPKNLIIILGPTAIGKTALSLSLAKHFDTEIISADSRQIYRELKIGTAIPNSQELHTVKHNLLQHRSITDYYSASNFETEAIEKINELFLTKDIIIMTGGSMMYIDVVCNGIDDLPTIEPDIRKDVIDRHEKYGLESLRLELKNADPEYYRTVDLKNPKRILHALEVFYQTGKPYSSYLTKAKTKRNFNIIKIGLNTEREKLHERINTRVDKMITEGLVEEARGLIGFKALNSLNTVGYRELFEYFEGKITLDQAIELIKRNTRRYARRQLTWFRKDESIKWFDIKESDLVVQHIEEKLNSIS